MTKKVLVIETGGTFATSSEKSIRTLAPEKSEKLVYDYDSVKSILEKHDIEIQRERPIYTLSENMTFEKLNTLLSFMYSLDYEKYDGIIITHGTDTMAYTANLLSMLFSGKGIPIVLVGSNHPLSIKRSNGVENFIGALEFISELGLQGVYVTYKTNRGELEVHLGSRIKQMNQIVDAYESFKNLRFGTIADGKFIRSEDPNNPGTERIKRSTVMGYDRELKLGKRIVLIYPYVGLRYDYFKIDESIDGIVCGVYHSGTLCAENAYIDQSINSLIDKADKFSIPVYIGELSSKNDHYESFDMLKKSENLHPIYDISLENLYVKANIAHSLFDSSGDRVSYIDDLNVFFEKVVD